MDRRRFVKSSIVGAAAAILAPCQKLFAKSVREVKITKGKMLYGIYADYVEKTMPADFPWRTYSPLSTALVTLTTNISSITNAAWPRDEAIPFVGERIDLWLVPSETKPTWCLRGTCIECFPAKKYARYKNEVTNQYVIRISGEMVKT